MTKELVRKKGLEPLNLAVVVFETTVFTNFTISAYGTGHGTRTRNEINSTGPKPAAYANSANPAYNKTYFFGAGLEPAKSLLQSDEFTYFSIHNNCCICL